MRYLHYTLYRRGRCGLSNLMMSAEIGVIAAHLTGRVLLLEGNETPTANLVRYGDPPLDEAEPSRLTDLIELPVPWVELERLDRELDTSGAFILGRGAAHRRSLFCWPPGADPTAPDLHRFANGRSDILTYGAAARAAEIIRLFPPSPEGRANENFGFYSYFFYLDEASRRSVHGLLRRMRPRPPYAELAERIASELGGFNAVHVRRGDFKQTFGVTTLDRSAEELLAALEPHFDPADPLVVLTDEMDDPVLQPLLERYPRARFMDRIILDGYRDEVLGLPRHDSVALAYLAQLVAGHASDFVGTMTSTFTSMIQRYRGNRGLAEPFKFLWNEIPDEGAQVERGSHPPSTCVPLRDGVMVEEHEGPYSWNRFSTRLNPAWQREWPESFLEVSESPEPRPAEQVSVQLYLTSGHTAETELPAGSELLRDLFALLSGRAALDGSPPPQLLQVPIDGGGRALSFSRDQLVAVLTEPPVLLEPADPARARSPLLGDAPYLLVDDLLTPAERLGLRALLEANRELAGGGELDPALGEGPPALALRRRLLVLLEHHAPETPLTVDALRVQTQWPERAAPAAGELLLGYRIAAPGSSGHEIRLWGGPQRRLYSVAPDDNSLLIVPADALESARPRPGASASGAWITASARPRRR